MKVVTSWNSGNFSLRHEVEVGPEQVAALASDGLLYRMQRNREHDEVLGAFTKDGEKKVRKPKWKRIDVGYDAGLAAKLKGVYGGDEAMPVVTEVTEYIREAGADSKFTEEIAIAGRHESAGDLAEWLLEKCDYVGDTHGDDGEYHAEMLRAVRGYKLKRLAALKADI